jgi:hypothetical protein
MRLALPVLFALLVLAGCGGVLAPDAGSDSGRDWPAILRPETAGYDDEQI